MRRNKQIQNIHNPEKQMGRINNEKRQQEQNTEKNDEDFILNHQPL